MPEMELDAQPTAAHLWQVGIEDLGSGDGMTTAAGRGR